MTPSLIHRLKERKLVQWAIAYLAGAWVLFEVSDAVGGRLGWPDVLYHGLLIVLAAGFLVTLVIAWYHGEQGRQRVSGPELLMVSALLIVAGGVLSMLGGLQESASSPSIVGLDDHRPGIAVLPCENNSPEPDDAYLAPSIHDEILLTLGRISSLRSIGRETVQWYRENPRSVPEIAEDLSVGFVAECSVQRDPVQNQVRLRFQLLDAGGAQVWAEEFREELTNLFEVQARISQQVAFHLRAEIAPGEMEWLTTVPTESLDAYEHYLRGNEAYLLERQTGAYYAQYPSIEMYELALSVDPDFAIASARMALSLTHTVTSAARLEPARRLAERAIALGGEIPEARVALARYYWLRSPLPRLAQTERPWTVELERALQAAPNNPLVLVQSAVYRRSMGEYEGALEDLLAAERLDPGNALVLRPLQTSQMRAHQWEAALATNTKLLAFSGNRATPLHDRAWLYLLQGDTARARMTIDELLMSDQPARPYLQIPMTWAAIVLRFMTPEQRKVAFEAFPSQNVVGSCQDVNPGYCLRRAIHEEYVGSRERAALIWDSLRVGIELHGALGALTPGLYLDAALVYMRLGEKEAALDMLQESTGRAPEVGCREDSQTCVWKAVILAHFGDHNEAIALLEELVPAPSLVTAPVLKVDPHWDPLRDHPRFQALLEKYADDVEH